MPETLRDAVLLRVEGLSSEAKDALEVASVAGLRFDLGLVAELAQAKSTLETAGLTVQCDAATTMKLPAVQESVLSLAVREAVTNVVRHAQARTCRMRLEQQNGSCRLEIHDDGCGSSNGEGNVTIAHEDSPDKLTVVQTLKTERGARTMALDSSTHRIYLAAARYEAPAAGAPADARPVIVPNSMHLLVYGINGK